MKRILILSVIFSLHFSTASAQNTEKRDNVKDEPNQEDFKNTLKTFLNLYSFLSQIMPFQDAELEKYYTYSRFLMKKLPRRGREGRFQLGDEISLEYYRLQKISEQNLVLEPKGEYGLDGSMEGGIRVPKEEKTLLSEIIKFVNKHFGTDFTEADRLFFDQIEAELVADPKLKEQAESNTIENFKFGLDEIFFDKLIGRMEQNQDLFLKIMDDKDFGELVKTYMLKKVYGRLNKPNQVGK